MMNLVLSDGTKLEGFTQNGTNYISKTKVDESIFDGTLDVLVIEDEETKEKTVYHNAELVQQVQYADGWYLSFREVSEMELFMRSITGRLEYVAMMADVDLEEV